MNTVVRWPTKPCRSCGAPVWWAVTDAAKRIPVDPVAAGDGNIIVLFDPAERGMLRVRVLRKDESTDQPRYRTHFTTCPNADTWRQKT